MRLPYFLAACLAVAAVLLFPVLGWTSSSGAPAGLTGGPGDFGTCQVCHSTYDLDEGTGSVTVQGPETFIPGMAYELSVTVDNTTEPAGDDPVQGFQISVQDAEGNHVGELMVVDAVNTRFSAGSVEYVTHTSAGRFESTWIVQWTAPPEDAAPEMVTVYATGNAAAGNGNPSADYIYSTAFAIKRQVKSSEPPAVPGVLAFSAVYPNPMTAGGIAVVTLERTSAVTLRIYDGLGRVVRTVEPGLLEAGQREIALDVAGLAGGMYFVEIATPEGSVVRPVTVAR